MPNPQTSSVRAKPNVIQLRKMKTMSPRKRLIGIGLIALVLIAMLGIIIYSSIRLGGIQNLFAGDGNVISNVGNNVNDAITSTGTPTPTPTEFKITDIPDIDQTNIDRDFNSIIFSPGDDNVEITIRKGTKVHFINETGKNMGLKFSDGRQVRVEKNGSNYETFLRAGVFTFSDQIDIQNGQIKGKITVLDQ